MLRRRSWSDALAVIEGTAPAHSSGSSGHSVGRGDRRSPASRARVEFSSSGTRPSAPAASGLGFFLARRSGAPWVLLRRLKPRRLSRSRVKVIIASRASALCIPNGVRKLPRTLGPSTQQRCKGKTGGPRIRSPRRKSRPHFRRKEAASALGMSASFPAGSVAPNLRQTSLDANLTQADSIWRLEYECARSS